MQNKSIYSYKNSAFDKRAFDTQFTSLNNNEMNTLRGGDIPPLPPDGGDDYPIDLLSVRKNKTSKYSVQLLPVLTDVTL